MFYLPQTKNHKIVIIVVKPATSQGTAPILRRNNNPENEESTEKLEKSLATTARKQDTCPESVLRVKTETKSGRRSQALNATTVTKLATSQEIVLV